MRHCQAAESLAGRVTSSVAVTLGASGRIPCSRRRAILVPADGQDLAVSDALIPPQGWLNLTRDARAGAQPGPAGWQLLRAPEEIGQG